MKITLAIMLLLATSYSNSMVSPVIRVPRFQPAQPTICDYIDWVNWSFNSEQTEKEWLIHRYWHFVSARSQKQQDAQMIQDNDSAKKMVTLIQEADTEHLD